jgi:hypothetical protein
MISMKKPIKKACFINEKGDFIADHEKIHKWYATALASIEDMLLTDEEIPFVIFLMGCETALRCQEQETIH